MLTAIVFIIILGVLIFVHEFGHFVTARRNGIKADEFGFGFPPRMFGFVRDEKTGKFKLVPGNRSIESKNTIYSINWIPLGGFVRIKGEGGENKDDTDSFSSKTAWTRIKVLAAGVIMNFLLAWFLISIVFMLGAPLELAQFIDKNIPIKISQVSSGSPAEQIGIKVGDEILKDQKNGTKFTGINDFIGYVNSNKGKNISIDVMRGGNSLNFSVTPRVDVPVGQGSLGVGFDTAPKSYPWYIAIWNGLLSMIFILYQTVIALGALVGGLFVGNKTALNDVAGPVGIAILAKQAVEVGFTYVALFTALISINLGIINILPIPALDGGRILFIIIEKIKGKPVDQKTEQLFHTIGFILLIMLMILVTFRDVAKLFK